MLQEKMIIAKDGSHIHYITGGKGIPLVFLHGNGNDFHYFSQQLYYFKQHYFVLAMDSRGQGQSTNKKKNLEFSLMVEDLFAILKREQLKKVILIGFSDGANLALEFATAYPNQVKGLVLNSGNLFPKGLKFIPYLLTVFQIYGAKCLSLFSRSWKKRTEVYQLMLKPLTVTQKQLHHLFIPSLVIVGEYDLIDYQHSKKIAQSLPNSLFIVIKHAGHHLARKKASLFNHVIEKFIKERILK